jgi:hypothetical protein
VRGGASIQSLNLRGSRSTSASRPSSTARSPRTFSPLIIGETAQCLLRRCHPARPRPSVPSSPGKSLNVDETSGVALSSFSPVLIGEVAQPTWSQPWRTPGALPPWLSVPSSSGKSLNSTLQKPRRGAGFQKGFEKPPGNSHSYRAPPGSFTTVRHSESPYAVRVFARLKKVPGFSDRKNCFRRAPACRRKASPEAAGQSVRPSLHSQRSLHPRRPNRSPRSPAAGGPVHSRRAVDEA